MKLLCSDTSPYVRKVRITAIEKGLYGSLEEVKVVTADSPKELTTANPLGKIPALVLDDGSTIIDSPVICEYLDSIGAGAELLPRDGDERFRVQTLHALADGVMDAAVALIMENKRPEQYRYPPFMERQKAAISRAFDVLESDMGWADGLNLAHIAIATALGYIDFRHPYIEWRNGRKSLSAWHENFSKRPSYIKTAPKE